MFQDLTIAYNSARRGHKRPVVLAAITSTIGDTYIYAMQAPTAAEIGSRGLDLFDGRRDVGSGRTFGSFPVVIWEARVEQFGGLAKSLTVNTRDILASMRQAEIGAYSITYDNHDGHFSGLLQNQSFLTCQFELRQGFAGLTWGEMAVLFTAEIVEERLSSKNLRILIESESQLGSPQIGGTPGEYSEEAFDIEKPPYLYVSKNSYSHVEAFTEEYISSVIIGSEGTGDGKFSNIWGISSDSSGNIYVVDNGNNRIQKFTRDGVFLLNWGSYGTGNDNFDSPIAISCDSSGNVYVSDTGNHRIMKFDASGTYLTQWGSYGTGDTEFDSPVGVAHDISNNVYVCDQGNDRIMKFDASGTYLTQWGGTGSGNTEFQGPFGVGCDLSGNVYVSDSGNNRIQKFSSVGGYLTQWGSSGTGQGEFDAPELLTVANDKVYVCDPENERLQVFDTTGVFITMLTELGYPEGVAIL